MQLHVVLPNESVDVATEQIVGLAVRAEELGYDMVWLPDHLLPPADYGAPPGYGGVYEPLVTLSYIAARTTRVRLGTSVFLLPLRNPFAVAKQVATLDRLSDGRFTLGVGIGWDATEFDSVGVDFSDRAGRTDEALRLLRHLFTTGTGPFEGKRFGFETGVFAPKPGDGLQIMVGGVSDPALRRVARYADVWQSLPSSPEEFAVRVGRIRRDAERPIEVGMRSEWSDPGVAVDTVVEQARTLEVTGADHLAIWFGDVDGFASRMATFAQAMAGA
jgi:probable F420-dependent oxidoreductase